MLKYFKSISITIKIIVYFLIISNLALYVVGKYSFAEASSALMNRTFQQLTSIRIEKKKRLDDFFEQRIADLNILALKKSITNIFYCFYQNTNSIEETGICEIDTESGSFLKGFLGGNKFFDHIVFVDTNNRTFEFDGNHLVRTTSFLNKIDLLSFESGLHEIMLNETENKLIICKLIIEKNIVIGSIILELSYSFVDDIMLESNSFNGLGKSGETYLVGSDFLMRSSSRFVDNSILKQSVNSNAVQNALDKVTDNQIITDYREITVLSSYSPLNISGLNWVILAEIDRSEAMIPINSLKNSIIYLSIIISLLLLGVVALLSNSLLSPLKKLKLETELIYKGKYGSTISLNYKNELGALIDAFNKMSLQLKDQEEKIELEKIMRLTSLIEGQEIERSRLSKELHDGLAQQLLAVKMSVEKLNDSNFDSKIGQIRDEFGEIINEIRNISNDLMPSVLINYGFRHAVEDLQRNINKAGLIDFELLYESDIESISRRVDLYMYRIVQETLNNTLKHSHAGKYQLRINSSENFVLEIADNGIGLKLEQNAVGNGLRNIQERVNIIDGRIDVFYGFENGFKMIIHIPL
jgi:signal transduction histidine kinase